MKPITNKITANLRTFNPQAYKSAYSVSVIDFPWYYSNNQSGKTSRGGITYSTMKLPDILQSMARIAITMKPNSTIFLWHTWPKQTEYANVLLYLKKLGYEAISGMPWVKVCQSDTNKPKYGIGYHWGVCSELCTMFRRGTVKLPDKSKKPLGLIADGIYAHSKKPNSIYKVAERYNYDRSSMANFFAIQPVYGWDNWGNFETGR